MLHLKPKETSSYTRKGSAEAKPNSANNMTGQLRLLNYRKIQDQKLKEHLLKLGQNISPYEEQVEAKLHVREPLWRS